MSVYNVVGYQSRRMEILVEADSEEEARHAAEAVNEITSDRWVEDYDYYEFKIKSIDNIEDKS